MQGLGEYSQAAWGGLFGGGNGGNHRDLFQLHGYFPTKQRGERNLCEQSLVRGCSRCRHQKDIYI